jgi:hypothetical protein
MLLDNVNQSKYHFLKPMELQVIKEQIIVVGTNISVKILVKLQSV